MANYGTLTLNGIALSGNSALYGAGVYNEGTLTVLNSTLSGNSASQGGGVSNQAGTATLSNSTLNGNLGLDGGGGVDSRLGGAATLINTILANVTGGNCVGAVTSLGHNLASDASCPLTATGDQPGTDPLLGPLADNGGPTRTHLPQPDSSAIDAGTCTDGEGNPVNADQRGIDRPQGAACDIGAVEVRPPSVTLAPTSLAFGDQQVGTTGAPQTVTLINGGELPLVITGITASGDFAQSSACPLSPAGLPPAASCAIDVTFGPTAVGPRGGTLTISHNAAGGQAIVALTGTGTVPPPPPPPPPATATYTLALSATGGGGATGGGSYPAGSIAALAATPDAGNVFLGWTLDGQFVGWATPLTLTMDGDHVALATFAVPPAFPDVGADTPYEEAIRQLAARGVIRGYQDGRFGPEDTTLRAQMAALIARAMGWDAEDHGTSFPDRGDVDADLWRNVGTLAFYDVARGYPDGTFKPTEPVLCAQVVSFITRAMVAKGARQPQPDDPALYPNVPASSGHREDIATFVRYVGAIPGTAGAGQPWASWDEPSTRAWHAAVLWRALDSYWGVDRVE